MLPRSEEVTFISQSLGAQLILPNASEVSYQSYSL